MRVVVRLSSSLAIAGVVAACSQGTPVPSRTMIDRVPAPRLVYESQPIPVGGGSYKIGAPYRIGERWYFPKEDTNYDRVGLASWYGTDFHGKKTANGEIFDMNALTAAHPTLPLPSYVYVTNIANGRTLLIRVNDRGPYKHDRILDLSRQAARWLGTETPGVGQIRVRYGGRAPLDGNPMRERQYLAGQPWASGVTAARPSPQSGPRMSLGAGG